MGKTVAGGTLRKGEGGDQRMGILQLAAQRKSNYG